ncbi:hypothetical protein F2Q70_00016644 [Brassica cretica]|uniref:Uncharacterized protein n=1 Tax=Brassica cretica TaxID=69181 RepID=A0A8S9I4T8_BRACR|nr:hypothetical protein F2Q70_00016644 [Brassica cretica]KAF2598764.1 hypothetical protein F2Q68_00009610 [Brassica cretica]
MALTVLCGSTEEHVSFVVVSARSMVWWICRRFRGPGGSSELMAFARYLRTGFWSLWGFGICGCGTFPKAVNIEDISSTEPPAGLGHPILGEVSDNQIK